MDTGNDMFEVQQDESTLVFPIDFSMRELSDVWEMDWRGIKDYLIGHPLLQKDLSALAPGQAKDNRFHDKGKVFPLPVELEPFLKSFYKISKNASFRLPLRDAKIPNDIMEQFLHQFCKDLVKELSVQSDNRDLDLKAFCRHVLFKNDFFNDEAIESLWENQFDRRVDQLRKLSKSLPFETQAQILQNCLLALDYNILLVEAERKQETTKERRQEESGQIIDLLLKDLLSARNESRNISGQYELPNIPVPSSSDEERPVKDLNHAFQLLRSNRNRKYKDKNGCIDPNCLLWRTRRCYVNYLAVSTGEPLFEKQYFELQDYLKLTGTVLDEGVLKRTIENRMIEECEPIIDYCCCTKKAADLKALPQTLPMDRYVEVFRDYISKKVIQLQIIQYKDVYDAVNTNREIRTRYNNLLEKRASLPADVWDLTRLTMCKGIRTHFEPFAQWLNRMWQFLCQNGNYGSLQQEDFSYIIVDAEQFASGGKRAAAFLGRTDLFEYSVAVIRKNKELISNLRKDPDSLTSPDQWLDAIEPFLIGGVLQVLEKIINERVAELLPNFIALQKLWSSMGSNSCNGTGQQN